MANKILFIGLIVALLQVASAEEANPEPYMNDAPLTIYVDAGKEIDQFLSLAKSIDGKQNVLKDTLERMSAEIKATVERCTQKVSKLERKLKYLINLQTNSSILHKRAELACQEIDDLRSAGIHNNTIPYIIHFVSIFGVRRKGRGVLIEKRFVLITDISVSHLFQSELLEFCFSDKIVSKEIKKVHPILEYDFFDAITLVELDSDVDYNYWLYPTCLYTSEFISKSALMINGRTIQIAEDSNCFDSDSKKLHPFEICLYDSYSTDNPVFLVEEETLPQLFGFLRCHGDGNYHTVHKVFPHLNFIENIVWPKNGK